jgi:hypothetical protein
MEQKDRRNAQKQEKRYHHRYATFPFKLQLVNSMRVALWVRLLALWCIAGVS